MFGMKLLKIVLNGILVIILGIEYACKTTSLKSKFYFLKNVRLKIYKYFLLDIAKHH